MWPPLSPGFPAAFFLAPLFCFQTGLFGGDSFMRDNAEPRRQSLFPALFFPLFGLEINVIRIFEPSVPFATKFSEVCPIVLFALMCSITSNQQRIASQPSFEDLFHVTAAVKDGGDLQRCRLGPVDDQKLDGEEVHIRIS